MKLIPELCPPLTVAILPIGDNFTMGMEEAALAANFIACNTIVGCHFDTFPPMAIDREQVKAHFSEKNINLILPEIKEQLIF